MQGAAKWQTIHHGIKKDQHCLLGLTDGVNAVAITQIDNAKYDSITL